MKQHNVDFIGGDFNMSAFSPVGDVFSDPETNTMTLRSALDLVTKLLTPLCSYISVPPTYLAPTASCAVNMRNKEGLSADITQTSVCGDDVLDRDVAHQSHVSAHFFLPRRSLVNH